MRCDDTLTIPEGSHCILQRFMEAVFVIYIILYRVRKRPEAFGASGLEVTGIF